jgi:formate-dependent nitrite reductase membrane component NrfD
MSEHEITWASPVALDIFFAGLAAGAFCFSVLMSKRRGEGFRACSQAAALLAPVSVAFGLCMLVLDLRYKTRFWFTMTAFNSQSPMSQGVWLLTIFSNIASLYAIFWIPSGYRERIPVIGKWSLWSNSKIRDLLGWVGFPFAVLVSIYTGVFFFSSMVTGFAGGLLFALLFSPGQRKELMDGPLRWLRGSYRVLLPIYFMVILLYIILFLTQGKWAAVLPLITGWNGLVWWLGVVGVGIVYPLVLVFRKAITGLPQVFVLLVAVLAGGFLLRLVLVFSGQEHIFVAAYRLVHMS